MAKKVVSFIPQGRPGEAEEIADAIQAYDPQRAVLIWKQMAEN